MPGCCTYITDINSNPCLSCNYFSNFENSAFSQLRYSYFEKLIVELKNHGEVYLVRLPVSRQMIELEKEYMQDFGYKIQSTANNNNIRFIDFYPEATNYLCPDGNHLYWKDAAWVSKKIRLNNLL